VALDCFGLAGLAMTIWRTLIAKTYGPAHDFDWRRPQQHAIDQERTSVIRPIAAQAAPIGRCKAASSREI
jgi:hypothetical protein